LFYTNSDLFTEALVNSFDVIRISNVLEHLTEPSAILNALKKLLKKDGYFLIEGPIENNFTIANVIRRFYFNCSYLVNPQREVSFPPFHIFLANRKNQLAFFEKQKLKTIDYRLKEHAWPFPTLESAVGIKQKSMALAASVSIALSKLAKNKLGNGFTYIGKPLI